MKSNISDWIGSATIEPSEPVIAGIHGTWHVSYTVGRSAIDDGGKIRLAWRSVSDHGTPQFDRPNAEGYVRVTTTGTASVTPVYAVDGVRPWSKTVTLRVGNGQLAAGERVTFVLGDTSSGSTGMRTQTYPDNDIRFKLLVDPFGTGIYELVADLGYEVVGGPATQLMLTAPSDVVRREPSWLQVRALDRWGNPDPTFAGAVRFAGDIPEGLPENFQFSASDGGVRRFEDVRYLTAGTLTVQAAASVGNASSNPIRCHENVPEYRVFWGDLHGQTRETVGTGTIENYFAYARDVSAVDACAHSGNDFQITTEVYQQLRDASERFHEPGRFVTFHGYEWSGNTPAGGDHNVYYRDDGPIRRSSHTEVDDKSDIDTDCYPIDRLYAANTGSDDVLITPHIGGRRANLDYHDPDLEPAIELASQWGRFEWFARDALERGLKVGFIGGSDDHSGRPGWSAPTLAHHGVRGGLTAYMATELNRDSIWEALRSRRVYGTSGVRMLLDVSVNDQPMGAEFTTSETPVVQVKVHGTTSLDTIELRRGLETVHTLSLLPEPEPDEPVRIRLAWRGARNRDRSRALDWTGGVQVTNGSILNAANYAIDSPLDGVTHQDAESVQWQSHTCGDWDGVVLELDGDANTHLRFTSPTMTFDFALADLDSGTLTKVGPLLEQQVVVRRLSYTAGPSSATFTWTDENPVTGMNPYWIWVTQSDGELGWSSPAYVHWNE